MSAKVLAVTGVPLKWTNDTSGYQCPYCGLFVCIPRATWSICPRCPAIPVDETVALVLSDAGIDDEDLGAAVEALMPILRALPARLPDLGARDADVKLTDADIAILLTPCECGHTINDHGELAGCWACADDERDCRVSFEALLTRAVEAIVARAVNGALTEAAADADAVGRVSPAEDPWRDVGNWLRARIT